MLLTHALALSASQFVHKKKSQRIYTSMHSAGLQLTKLTYTRLEDNLIRHRGMLYADWARSCSPSLSLLSFVCGKSLFENVFNAAEYKLLSTPREPPVSEGIARVGFSHQFRLFRPRNVWALFSGKIKGVPTAPLRFLVRVRLGQKPFFLP